MKLPSKINILGVPHKVSGANNLFNNENQALAGCINYESRDIKISTVSGLSRYMTSIVLMHEILHGLLGLMATIQTDDEELIDRLAVGLVQIIKDNPELVKFIVNSETEPGSIGVMENLKPCPFCGTSDKIMGELDLVETVARLLDSVVDDLCSDPRDEGLEALLTGLSRLLQDNPEVVKYLERTKTVVGE